MDGAKTQPCIFNDYFHHVILALLMITLASMPLDDARGRGPGSITEEGSENREEGGATRG